MYFYSMINSIEPAFLMGSLFGVMLMLCLGCLAGALFATNKLEFFCCIVMLTLFGVCLYFVLLMGVQ